MLDEETIPRLGDDPAYRDDPLHAGTTANTADAGGDDPLTPLEELAIEHVMGDRPFVVECRLWNLRVRYRVLDERQKQLCVEGAREGRDDAERAMLLPKHWLTRAIVDIDGTAPVAEEHQELVGTDEELGARFVWLLGRKSPFFQRLLTNFLRVQALYGDLLGPDHLPKSSSTADGAGSS